ncbi:MAG: hypothetical protein JWO84_575 [Parcubacteria group bacterium]|nr:hypothetical protein [Parcubacteria group bacterium]
MYLMDPIQPAPPDQSVVSLPSYQLPGTPKARPHRTGLIIVTVIVVLLLLATGLYFFTPYGKELQARLMPASIPPELQSASFLSDVGPANTMMYRFPKTGKTREDAGAVVISATQSTKGSARITRAADGTFTVSLDGKAVQQDKTPRVGIDRAPDGASIVFAVASSTSQTFTSPADVPTLPLIRKNWSIVMYVPSTHTTIRLGTGASPFFIDQTHVAWLAPVGLAVIDLTTKKSTVLVPDMNGRISSETLVSPDHSIVAWYAGVDAKTLVPYKVTATSAYALATTTLTTSHSIILGNDSFYEIGASSGATQILKQPFGASASVVGSIPLALKISRILFGSL